MATNNAINNASPTLTSTTVYSTTFDTNVAAAGVTLVGTTLAADGSETNIDITITPKGTGAVVTSKNIEASGVSFDSGTTILANYVTLTTWTPTVSFGGGTTGITYSTQSGYYSRIGNICFIRCYIILTSKGTDTGDLRIEGLPIDPAVQTSYQVAMLGNVTFSGDSLWASTRNGNRYTSIFYSGNSSESATEITDAECENGTRISIGGFYYI